MDDAAYLESLGIHTDDVATILDAVAYTKQIWNVQKHGYPKDSPGGSELQELMKEPDFLKKLIAVVKEFEASDAAQVLLRAM